VFAGDISTGLGFKPYTQQ